MIDIQVLDVRMVYDKKEDKYFWVIKGSEEDKKYD